MPTGQELTMIQQALANSNNPIIQGSMQAPQIGMGMLLGRYQDKRQLKQSEKLQALQIAGNKELTDYNMQKAMEMWNATNYGAQVAHMKEAGLNPAMIYGMGGGGGQTASVTPGNTSGQQAAAGGGIESMVGMGIQLGMMQAQKQLMEAQTQKTKAEADKISGVDTTLTQTQTASLTQGIENQKAQQKLTEAQTKIANLDAELKGKTIDEQIEIAERTSLIALEHLHQASNETFISQATKQAKVDIIRTEVVAALLRNSLTSAQITKTGAETAKAYSDIQVNNQQLQNLAAKIVQDWRSLELKGQEVSNQQRQVMINDANQQLQEMKVPVEIAEKVVQAIFLRNLFSPGHTPIRGLHNR